MEKKTVRLRRATITDFDFCKQLHDDISYEILYENRKAFGLPEIKYDNEDEIEFDPPKLEKDFFEKCITKWRHKVYIIEYINKKEKTPIGCFNVAKSGKGEPNRIINWLMLNEYFCLKEEALKCLLKRKELTNTKITVNIMDNDCAFDWLVKNFGFREDNDVLSTLSLINQG